jgi:microcystin-dependent protein
MRMKIFMSVPIVSSIGNTGGERLHRLTINEMLSHSHKISFYKAEEDDGSGAITTGYRSGINLWREDCIWTNPIGGDQPHNVMCPYYALAYIMKK